MAVATATSVNVKQAVPFFGVSNMAASLRFYVHGLGFKMKNYWIPDGAEGHAEDQAKIMLTAEFAGAGWSWGAPRSCCRSFDPAGSRTKLWGTE